MDLLTALAYALILPAIAVLQVRHRDVRAGGAVLGTVTGTATVAVGLVASFTPDLLPAETLLRGMWWWTIGKMWAQTAVLPRGYGVVTAGLGVLTIAAALASGPLLSVAPPLVATDLILWTAGRYITAAWLVALALVLVRPR